MTIAADTGWEVRTTGTATGGGGYATSLGGTDYSQQNAPQLTRTDLACVGGVTITSATGGFTAAMVGNCAYVTGGGATTGIYQIIAYASGNSVNVDRTPGVAVNGTINVGGAFNGLQLATSIAVAGNTIWIKAGTYTLTAVITTANAGTITLPITVERYDSTHGDGTAPTAVLDANGGAYNVCTPSVNYWSWKYLRFRNTAATGLRYGVYVSGANNSLWRCCADTAAQSGIFLFGNGCVALGCEAYNCGTGAGTRGGIDLSGYGAMAVGCNSHHNNTAGKACSGFTFYTLGSRRVGLLNCIAYSNGGYGVEQQTADATQRTCMVGCVVHGNTLGGISLSASADTQVLLQNNILSSNGGYGINTTGAGVGSAWLLGNAFYNNATGEIGPNVADVRTFVPSITLTDDPFVDAANGDFRLNRTALALLGAGFPQRFLVNGVLSPWAGFPDIGAVLSGRGIGDLGSFGGHWKDTRKTWDGG